MKSISLARGEPTALVLLNLSAAFDTIDNNTLPCYLESWFDLDGTVLKWFVFYLSNCFQVIRMGSTLSEVCKLIYGVSQGSVLAPLSFSLCTTPLSKIISLHLDGAQLYVHLSHKHALTKLNTCLQEVQQWMALSKLKLNPDKTESIVLGSTAQRQKL